MKRSRKLRTALLAVLVLALVGGSTLAVAAAGGWLPASWTGSENSDMKYEKPSLNEVANEGVAPAPMEPDASALSTDKPWYEYITYSAEAVGEYEVDNIKYKYYDPYDYSYGLIMDIKDTNVATTGTGRDTIPCPFSSANEVSVTWSASTANHFDHSIEVSADPEYGFETDGMIKHHFTITAHVGYSHEWGVEYEEGVELSQTFSAVHYNSKGAPYQWKVVNYVVSLPICVEVYKKSPEGEYILDRTTYMLVPTVQGACREYIINGVVYIEDWRTGEGVPLDDFWDEFMTPDKIKEHYTKNMLPTFHVAEETTEPTEGGMNNA